MKQVIISLCIATACVTTAKGQQVGKLLRAFYVERAHCDSVIASQDSAITLRDSVISIQDMKIEEKQNIIVLQDHEIQRHKRREKWVISGFSAIIVTLIITR